MDSQTAVHHSAKPCSWIQRRLSRRSCLLSGQLGDRAQTEFPFLNFFHHFVFRKTRVFHFCPGFGLPKNCSLKKPTHKTRWILCSPPFQQLRSQVFSGYGVFMNDVWAEAVAEAQPLGLTEQQLLAKLKSRWDQMTGVVLAKKPTKNL